MNTAPEGRGGENKVSGIDIIDFHSHILPSADHGSSSVETSLLQLELAERHSVGRIVATPHFYPDRHDIESFLNRRNAAWDALREASDSVKRPKIALGAEVLICDGIERLEGLERLCIQGTNVLLLELPFAVFKTEYRDSVSRLIKNGFQVVLAHADRYDPADIELLLERGAKIQLNADSLSGFSVRSHIKDWVLRGEVVALGSDIHSVDKKAYKRFDKALSRLDKLSMLDFVKRASDDFKIVFQ